MSQKARCATSKSKGNQSPQKEENLNGGKTVKSTIFHRSLSSDVELEALERKALLDVNKPESLKCAIGLWKNGARMLTRTDKHAKGVVKSAIWFLATLQKLKSFQELLDAYFDEKFANPLWKRLKSQRRLYLFQHGEDLAFWLRWRELLKGTG